MFSQSTYHQSIDLNKAITAPLPLPAMEQAGVEAFILRLDQIHPIISGNKWFKLKYHLKTAVDGGFKGLQTFGGAWSNHLVATAGAAAAAGLESIGIIRGERAEKLSPSLEDAEKYGMKLLFVSRTDFANESAIIRQMQDKYPDHYLIPQGGQTALGVKGAAEILQLVPDAASFTHIACAAGTGTMMAGLAEASTPQQQLLGFSSLKLSDTSNNSLTSFLQQHTTRNNYRFIWQYHFGGFAKKSPVLTDFMRDLYRQTSIPTDIVYTGKLLYGVHEMVKAHYFLPGSRILLIHSGGLQGNRSLPAGLLGY